MKEPPAAKGRVVSPQPDTTDASDKILTGSEATKRLGVPLSTIRSLVRNGSLRATSMAKGAVGLRESEIQRFLHRSEGTAQADLSDPQSIDGLPRNVHTEGDRFERTLQPDLATQQCIEGLLRNSHTERSPRYRIRKTLSTAMIDQPDLPKQRCRCGNCTTCQDAARWERVFQEKFADPDYYSRGVERRGGSSLS